MDWDEGRSDESPRKTKERLPDRGHRLPKLSWKRLLRPGISGATMIGLFLGTLLIIAMAAFLVGHH
jgi:hypothetical protein